MPNNNETNINSFKYVLLNKRFNLNFAAQSLSLHQLGICAAAPRRGLSFCAETGLDHRVQNAGGVSISPDCSIQLWDRGVKVHGRDSRTSSQSNSPLTLTDMESDGKVEHVAGKGHRMLHQGCYGYVWNAVLTNMRNRPSFVQKLLYKIINSCCHGY